MGALLLLACLLLPSPAAAAGPGAYLARRFDVGAKVLPGGSLDVTESITFEFQSGTFTKVWREIPASRTDGIDVIEAWMDGNPVTRGDGPGHIGVSGGNRVRVEWRFAPASPSIHRFDLRYIARGVAYREGSRDIVRWRFLPTEHRYTIEASRSVITAPVNPAGTPALESRRVGRVSSRPIGNGVAIDITGIRQNGWVIAELHFPAERIVTAAPAWQQREVSALALVHRWEMAAGGLFLAGLLVLFVIRQAYDTPGFDGAGQTTTTEPPEALPAALAAALAAKGRASGFQSVATLLDLANRGVLTVRELPRKLGVRHYELAQVPGKHDLDGHEAEALRIAFAGTGDEVTLSKARGRLQRRGSRFWSAVNGDLAERGLLDPSRKAVRDRLTVVSLAMLFSGGVGSAVAAGFIPRYQGWPMLLPLALVLCGIVGLVMTAATTPLSDAGLTQGARWRGFKRHLKTLADPRDTTGAGAIQSRWIVYAIALGLAYQWSRYLRKHPDVAPAWFFAAGDDRGGAFAAFVGSGAASTSGAGAGGGGAAGGGGSGAG